MILQPEDPRQLCFISRAELVSEEPLVLTVGQVVDGLDLGLLYVRYSEAGRSFYDPVMMLKLLFFSYCEGVRSLREIAKRIRYDVRYQYFTGSLRPDFRTINRFRQDNLDLLGECFARLVTLCEQSGLGGGDDTSVESAVTRRAQQEREEQFSRQQLQQEAALQDSLARQSAEGVQPFSLDSIAIGTPGDAETPPRFRFR